MKRIDLFIVDPQYDFVSKNGSLSVPDAEEDMKRGAEMIKRLGKKLTNIHVSMDSHQYNSIFFPSFILNRDNQHPAPFTPIPHADVVNGTYRAAKRQFQDWLVEYTKKLEEKGKYTLFLWPFHTIVGTKGWSLDENIAEALKTWELEYFRRVNFVVKGNNFLTEFYSPLEAEVPRADDPSTQLNTEVIKSLSEADEIPVLGEAKSHCVKSFLESVVNNFGNENIKKLVLINDCTSSVPGFEQNGEDAIKEMMGRGLRIINSVDYLV